VFVFFTCLHVKRLVVEFNLCVCVWQTMQASVGVCQYKNSGIAVGMNTAVERFPASRAKNNFTVFCFDNHNRWRKYCLFGLFS
jgi:hypothetical protein